MLLVPCMRLLYNGHDALFLYAETDQTSRIWRRKVEETQRNRSDTIHNTKVVSILESLHALSTYVRAGCRFPSNPQVCCDPIVFRGIRYVYMDQFSGL